MTVEEEGEEPARLPRGRGHGDPEHAGRRYRIGHEAAEGAAIGAHRFRLHEPGAVGGARGVLDEHLELVELASDGQAQREA